MLPLFKELAVGIENLDPEVLAIRDIDTAGLAGDDAVRGIELAFIDAFLAPLAEVIAVLAVFDDTRVTVAVGLYTRRRWR